MDRKQAQHLALAIDALATARVEEFLSPEGSAERSKRRGISVQARDHLEDALIEADDDAIDVDLTNVPDTHPGN